MMRSSNKPMLPFITAALVFSASANAMGSPGRISPEQRGATESTVQQHPYVGLWVTDDGHVRHALLPNGRYDEARGSRESAYRGRYEVTGSHIDYWDDTGFTADGVFIDENTLHHGGMVLRRK
ncbi:MULTISPECIES: Atu4866 domain-containing protein [unclassified Chelatococcus]|uniref:Atu4866 domain-containing protein n=1 Tax=unclassified Chelatococcus TaxID=2638111 RepID=UPI001BCB77D5|nr:MULTISPECIES: Atu4866 domain-containing protein [unclassified Chelatococcus]MBS7700700.1 Atu4866 domain-containing protein [Chelatococcus sp. YT9]MBX3559284.1 Atu4866 domain-containing protein [Chelatococcus sp.]